jgi:hypothetical protein
MDNNRLDPYPATASTVSRRRIHSEASISETQLRLLKREDCEELIRGWQLERRQLQIENQRLEKELDDAHKHIQILRKKKKKKKRDDGVASVTSIATTAKAGTAHRLAGSSIETQERKRNVFSHLVCWKVQSRTVDEREEPRIETPSVLDEGALRLMTSTRNAAKKSAKVPVPTSKLRRSQSFIKKTETSLMRPSRSCYFTDESCRASPAEF